MQHYLKWRLFKLVKAIQGAKSEVKYIEYVAIDYK